MMHLMFALGQGSLWQGVTVHMAICTLGNFGNGTSTSKLQRCYAANAFTEKSLRSQMKSAVCKMA